MIKLTIEMLPFGREDRKYKIGEMTITNTGDGTEDIGNYVVKAWNKTGHNFKQLAIVGFKRKTKSMWMLLKTVFELW